MAASGNSSSPSAAAGALSSAASLSPGEDAHGSGLSESQLQRGFLILAITTFAMNIAMNVSQTIQPNFFRDVIGMDGSQNGYLVAIREVPGFLLIFVAAFMLRLGMARAASVSLLIAGIGFALFAQSNSFLALVIPTLVSSVGYHSWMQLQPALGLSLARKGAEGTMLGRLSSIGFAGSMIALCTILVVLLGIEHKYGTLTGHQDNALRVFFVIGGIAAVVGAYFIRKFPISANDQEMARAAPKITWRREYRLYYWLAFLDGSRMQIYFAFAPFVLVEEFNVSATVLTTLLIIVAVINWKMGRVIGQMVDKYGEQPVLTVGYILHGVTFLGFALSNNVWMLYGFYILYNFLFLFSVGTTTYLRKISRREDLAPSLAMGVSLSHVTAIVVPIVGSALW
ncbi:MAG: MFS transporter, partial [Thermomicrobiales bacterium]